MRPAPPFGGTTLVRGAMDAGDYPLSPVSAIPRIMNFWETA